MATQIEIIVDRVNLTVEVQKDGEQLEKLEVGKYLPASCTHITCDCKNFIDSFFHGLVLKYRTAYGRRSCLTDGGDVVTISPFTY